MRDHALGELLAVFERLHERAGADLDVQHDRMRAGRQLFGHDGGRDERQRVDRRRHVAQGVELLVGGGEIAGLADDGHADLLDLPHESVRRKRGLIPGDGFELVDRAARMAEPAAGHLGHLAAERGNDGRDDQRRLVADAAGGMLVDGLVAEAAEVDGVAGMHHGVGQHGRLMVGHALVEDGHGEGGHLIVGNGAVRKAPDDEADLVVGQDAAVTLLFNEIDHSHG